MTTTTLETDHPFEFDKKKYAKQIEELIPNTISKFQKTLKSYFLFSSFFVLLIIIEVLYFFIQLTFLVQTFVVAIYVALIFATVFCYFTLKMYAQVRKTESLQNLKSEFIDFCRKNSLYPLQGKDMHLLIADACCKLAGELHGQEYRIYKCFPWCIYLSSTFEKMNCWLFWQDVHELKETLLEASINEHIHIVRAHPTQLEAHAGLANAYVILSGLYVDPRTGEGMTDEDRWIPPNKYNETFKNRFKFAAERAIEEFKILNDFAPHDPWVHAQLAYSYRDLKMPREEIQEYETILSLCPDDMETRYKLGKLYFQQGLNAKGLHVYETLKKSYQKKAESLIHFYGA